jgi:outer membrane protein assembly factor BamA
MAKARTALTVLAGTAAALILTSSMLTAQERKQSIPWKNSFYPMVVSQSNDFPTFVFHFEERRGADYYARTPYSGLAQLDLGASTHGSRFALITFEAPLLWDGWRVTARAGATRAARFGYFGIGNDTRNDPDSVSDAQPFFYRARRTRYFGTGELSRRITGPLWIAGAADVEHSVFSDLPQPSLFRQDFGTSDVEDTDVRGRVTLVLDTRDNEFDPKKGIFAEASAQKGSGGDGYARYSGVIRGYIPVREGTTIAARLAGSGMTGTPPLNALFEVPTWGSTVIPVFGGISSNRGYDFQRLAGEDVLMFNADIRHDLLNLGDFGAFTLVAFFDAGRVFQGEPFKLTTKDMKVGAGGGLAIRLMRFNIFTFNFAGGDDGFKFTAGTGWAF